MARYQKTLPMVDSRENTFNQIYRYLTGEGFQYRTRDGEQLFQKGKGVWLAPSFVKVTYYGNYVRLEAWVDAMGAEEGLEGFVGSAAKGPIKKAVPVIEQILTRPGVDFVPQAEEAPAAGESAPRFCSKCGTALVPGGKFCPSCGQIPGMPPIPDGAPKFPAGTTLREYYKKYAGEGFYKNLKITAICGYVLLGISGLANLIVNPFGIIDILIYLGLLLGMHLGKSRGCAIGLVVYAAVSVVINLILTGALGGWGMLIIGAVGLSAFSTAAKRYKSLPESGKSPE